MLEETGVVTKAEDGFVWVETQTRSSCSHCSTTQCTTSVVSKLFGIKNNLLKLENTHDARPGQRVVIGIPDGLLVRASFWAYLLPLFGMIGGVMLALANDMNDGGQALLAAAGLAAGLMLVKTMTQKASVQQKFTPELLRIADTETFGITFPVIQRGDEEK